MWKWLDGNSCWVSICQFILMNLCAFVIFYFYINIFIIFISQMCLFLFKNNNTDVKSVSMLVSFS